MTIHGLGTSSKARALHPQMQVLQLALRQCAGTHQDQDHLLALGDYVH